MPEEFPEDVVRRAYIRSGGQCECLRSSHGHDGRCPVKLGGMNHRGYEGHGGWEAHHKDSNGLGTLDNCEILCIECHKKTRSYGRH